MTLKLIISSSHLHIFFVNVKATSTARESEDKIAELETRAKDLDEAKSKFERSAQALKVSLSVCVFVYGG